MNRNQILLEKAFKENIPLNSLKLSKNFKKLSLKNYHIQDFNFSGSEFINASFEKVSFENCSFSNCFFEESDFENCFFSNCFFNNSNFNKNLIQNTELKSTEFKDIIIDEGKFVNTTLSSCMLQNVDFYHLDIQKLFISSCKMENGRSLFNKINDLKVENSRFFNCETEQCDISEVFITKGNFLENTFYKCRFKINDYVDNHLLKTNVIKCSGVPELILTEVLLNNGRTESLLSLLFKNKFFLVCFTLFSTLFVYIALSISISGSFLFVRYIFHEIWKDPYRSDLLIEASVIRTLIKDQKIRESVNEAIFLKSCNKISLSKNKFLESMWYLKEDRNYFKEYCWLINEVFLVSKKESEWSEVWKLMEYKIPDKFQQDIRLFMISLFPRKYYPAVTLKIMQKFLISNTNEKMFIKLNDIVDNIRVTLVFFKPKAYQMIRSFAKRKIKEHPDSSDNYKYIIENAEEWIKHYSLILRNQSETRSLKKE